MSASNSLNSQNTLKAMDTASNLLPFDGEVRYHPRWFDTRAAVEILEELTSRLDWTQEHARFFGKQVPLPRLTAWYGPVEYRYSGVVHLARPFVGTLARLAEEISVFAPPMDCVLANLYRSGADSVGWHGDDEEIWGVDPPIVSLSFGASRRFVLRHRVTKDTVTVDLNHGSVLVMSGATQAKWVHSIPKTAAPVATRVNLTYRRLSSSRS